jgi:hypothetical protein
MRTWIAVLPFIVACGKKADDKPKEQPEPTPAAVDAAIVKAPPADAAPVQPSGPSLYSIVDGDITVALTLTLPDGWTDQSSESGVVWNNGVAGSPTWLKIRLTCHGACGDARQLQKNIEQVAQERFDFTKSDSHIPQLAPVWDQEVTAIAPNVFRWEFHGDAASGEDWAEYYVATEHIVEVPGGLRILDCMVEPTKGSLAIKDDLVKICTELQYRVIPDPRIAWAIEVEPASVAVADLGKVELRIAATNTTKAALDPQRDPLDFTVDGTSSTELGMAFGNGGRGGEWHQLGAGATAKDRRVGVLTGLAPGEHVIAIQHLGHELAKVTLTVTP